MHYSIHKDQEITEKHTIGNLNFHRMKVLITFTFALCRTFSWCMASKQYKKILSGFYPNKNSVVVKNVKLPSLIT